MRILAKRTLRVFWKKHPDAEEPLAAWFREVEKEMWATPKSVKAKYRNACVVGGSGFVFNIKGNEYRLLVDINYAYGVVVVRSIRTSTRRAITPGEGG
jgi:mRNA interferase HigB